MILKNATPVILSRKGFSLARKNELELIDSAQDFAESFKGKTIEFFLSESYLTTLSCKMDETKSAKQILASRVPKLSQASHYSIQSNKKMLTAAVLARRFIKLFAKMQDKVKIHEIHSLAHLISKKIPKEKTVSLVYFEHKALSQLLLVQNGYCVAAEEVSKEENLDEIIQSFGRLSRKELDSRIEKLYSSQEKMPPALEAIKKRVESSIFSFALNKTTLSNLGNSDNLIFLARQHELESDNDDLGLEEKKSPILRWLVLVILYIFVILAIAVLFVVSYSIFVN